MKRIALLGLLMLVLSEVCAQKTFRAGILAGVSGCQIHGDTYAGYNQPGIVFGGLVSTNPEKKLHAVMEIQFSRKGSRKIANPEKGDYDFFELRLNYIEVPLLIRYGARKVFFEGGFSGGFLFRVREWDDFGEITPRDFRSLEFSGIIGIGYNFNEKWYMNFRSSNSLMPIKKLGPINYPVWYQDLFNQGMYNNIVTLSAVYRFSSGTSE